MYEIAIQHRPARPTRRVRADSSALALGVALLLQAVQLHAAPYPDAGTVFREFKDNSFERMAPKKPPEPVPQLRQDVEDTGATIYVLAYEIHGNTQLSEEALSAVLKSYTETELSALKLHEAADALTAEYHRAGVFAAKVFIPPQTISDGIVKLFVYEGRLDANGVILENSGKRIRDDVLLPILENNLKEGGIIRSADVERSILLLEDMPGIHTDVTLYPGEKVGTARLNYEIKDDPLITGNIDVDNFGSYYTGEARVGSTVYVESPSRSGDRLTLRLVTSGEDSNYGFLRYSVPVAGDGARVGFSTDYLDYKLGKEYSVFGSRGEAMEFRGYVTYPYLRSRHTNLDLGVDYVHLELDDYDDLGDLARRTLNSGVISISGDHDDDLFAAGSTHYSLGLTFGDVNIKGDQRFIDFDNQYPKTAGSFGKVNFAVSRLQHLGGKLSTLIALSGQLASKNLDTSQKFYLGGPFSLPGYPTGQVSGDDGALFHLDLRRDFYTQPWGGLFQASLFYAYGQTRIFNEPWDGWQGTNAIITNDIKLQSVGISVHQDWAQGFVLKGMVGWQVGENNSRDPLTSHAVDGSSEDYRAWLQGIYYF